MARITRVSNSPAGSEAAAPFAAIKGKIGMVPNLYRVAANQPAALAGLPGRNETPAGGALDARARGA